jgi:hypothetical protein
MTYLIKHPIVRYTPKFAIAYNSVDYTISSGIGTFTLSLNTLTQSAGMGLSLASNQITLAAKKYMIYYKAGLTNATESRAGDITILLNGVAVSTSQSVQAITTATTSGTSSGVVTPQNLASCLISATAGDVISFRYSRTSGDVYADTVGAAMSKAFILEIGEST